MHRPTCEGHTNLLPYEVHEETDGSLRYDTEEGSQYPQGWCRKYAQGLRALVEGKGLHLEARYDGRKLWVMDELAESTDRLKDESAASNMAGDIVSLEMTMKEGQERAHLKEMLRRLTIRGTELKLQFQEGGAGELPYPAYRWYFKKVFSYKWKEELHINIGELNSFISMTERRASDREKHGTRYLAILDSQVVRGALGKGRSPSRAMNRGLKKSAALLILMDAYPLLAWTISRWNWADKPSRVFQ